MNTITNTYHSLDCIYAYTIGQKILLTREEKERVFLDSIQSYYYSGKSTLSDAQFNLLRNDLSWEVMMM